MILFCDRLALGQLFQAEQFLVGVGNGVMIPGPPAGLFPRQAREFRPLLKAFALDEMFGQNVAVFAQVVPVQLFHDFPDFLVEEFFSFGQEGIVNHLAGQGMFEDVG